MELVTGKFLRVRSPKLRIWSLGSLEHKILPTKDTIQKLVEMLSEWDGQSDLDLVWGPDLQVQQFDLGPQGQTTDIVKGPEPLEVTVARDEGGELKATLVLREPMVRIIQRKDA